MNDIHANIYIHVETVSIGLFIARVCLNKSYLIRRIWIFSFSFRFNWKTCQPKMIWFIRHVLAQHQIYWLSAFNDELKLEKCHRNWFIRSAYWMWWFQNWCDCSKYLAIHIDDWRQCYMHSQTSQKPYGMNMSFR